MQIKLNPKLRSVSGSSRYLKKIDTKRYYSNFGPLYRYAKKKIVDDYRLKNNSVIFTSSGHSSLFACCLYLKSITKKKFILVPSFNFYSAPQAIIQSGFEPYFVDINKENFSIDIFKLAKILKKLKNNVAGIVAVSPFGYPLDIKKLNDIQQKFKTKIIYDAADTFINFDKNLDKSEIMICCSFHPTKTLPANESGIIICKKQIHEKIKNITSFGLNKEKEVVLDGFNGKFSEYDAAIFLANYSNINKIRNKLSKEIDYLKKKLQIFKKKEITLLNKFNENWVSTKFCIYSHYVKFSQIQKKFKKYGIEIYSGWNERPVHRHSLFKKFKKNSLYNTDKVSQGFFFIPINLDVKRRHLDLILRAIYKTFK